VPCAGARCNYFPCPCWCADYVGEDLCGCSTTNPN
jgi:hypothetical protein